MWRLKHHLLLCIIIVCSLTRMIRPKPQPSLRRISDHLSMPDQSVRYQRDLRPVWKSACTAPRYAGWRPGRGSGKRAASRGSPNPGERDASPPRSSLCSLLASSDELKTEICMEGGVAATRCCSPPRSSLNRVNTTRPAAVSLRVLCRVLAARGAPPSGLLRRRAEGGGADRVCRNGGLYSRVGNLHDNDCCAR